MEPVSRFYTSQRLRLHYADWGNENKPLLILVHGGMDHARSWDRTAKELREDFHVIAPDLRGHGDSAWASGSMYSVLDSVLDTVALVEKMGSPATFIIGHSYGAFVSLLYAGFYPESLKGLVLIEGGGVTSHFGTPQKNPLWKRTPEWINAVKRTEKRSRRPFDSIEEAEARIRKRIPTLSDDQIRHLTYHGISCNDDGTYSWKYDELSKILSPIRFDEEEMIELQGRISCPILFLYGSRGWSGNLFNEEMKSPFQAVKSMEIADAGHWLHHERFDSFIEIISSFLKE
jgi:pimeloyl-ACP methyl ester carboxylesterase